jgi:hypothetical protein
MRSSQERAEICNYPVCKIHQHTAEARGCYRTIGCSDRHGFRRIRRRPGTRGESGAYHTEIYRVGGACRGSKGHTLDFGDRSTDLLGDDQVGTCDIGFIEIVVIFPTQHCSQSVATEAAERATCRHLGICYTCSQHACIGGRAGPAAGDLPCVASDCKVGGEIVGIGSPLITVGGRTPQRLIRAREIVLSNGGSRC